MTQTKQNDNGKFDLNNSSSQPVKSAVHPRRPAYAKGVTPDLSLSYPVPGSDVRPVFEKNRRQEVLSLIHYPWEDLGFNVAFMHSRPGYRAMTLTARHRIEIYVRPGEGPMLQAYDLAHEFGHAFDLTNNTEERRRKWLELRGIKTSTPWFGCDACPDYGTPAGDFAETFAFLLLGPGNFHSTMAPAPTPDQIPDLAAFCRIEHISASLSVLVSKETEAARTQRPKPADPPEIEPVNTREQVPQSQGDGFALGAP